MRIFDALEIVWSTFVNNRMRTILTLFGVAIGMGAIIFLVSLGLGLQRLTIDKIAQSDALMTLSVTQGSSAIIPLDDTKRAQIVALPEVDRVGVSYAFSGHLQTAKTEADATVYPLDSVYLGLQRLGYLAGDDQAFLQSTKGIILSSAAASALGFTNPADAVGGSLHVLVYYSTDNLKNSQAVDLTVMAVSNETESNVVYVAKDSLKIPSGQPYATIKAHLKDSAQAKSTQATIEGMGLQVYSVADLVASLNNVFRIIQYVLLSFGLVALLVASLGMFNTLTISLIERTREVGIMKAIGATDGGVARLFLLEAVFLGTLGGFMGVVLGWGLGQVINVLVSRLAVSLGGVPVILFYTPPYLALTIVGFSFFVGLMTGFYPSRRAARLSVLDAIRYE